MHLAASACGISIRVFERWLQRGFEETAAREDPDEEYEPDHGEDVFVEFHADMIQARGRAAAKAILNVQRAAQGGAIIEETVTRHVDENGQIVETKTTRRAPPDWRASAFVLERVFRGANEFAKNDQLTVTGADGGAVQIEHSVNVDLVSARIRESLARHLEDRAITAGNDADDDFVVGEVVGD
jgi:hypothetical protein